MLRFILKFKFLNVFAGIDRLERLKGIPLKLMAIDEFMAENLNWKGKIIFTLIGISASERGQDYVQTQHDVKILVDHLNKKYGDASGPLVIFEEMHDKDIRLARRLAYFAASDILLMTATRYVSYPIISYISHSLTHLNFLNAYFYRLLYFHLSYHVMVILSM